MKKVLSLFLSLVMLLSITAGLNLTANADEDDTILTYGDYKYSINDDNTVTITGYTGSAKKLEIPSVVKGKKVTEINDRAFSGSESLTNVTIPKSVTGIGSCAFDGCINITKIEIPSSVKGIGENAFSYCSSLIEISVSNKNTAYSSKDGVLFTKDKKWLIQYPLGNERASYNIPDSVEDTEPFAFADCKNLKNLTLSNKMTSINYCAFYNCHSLISVTMPSSVTSIDESAFESCTNLKYIVIPSKVKYIGTDAFLDCTNLTEIYYPNSKSKWKKINKDGIKNVTVYFDSTLNEKQKTASVKKITPANASLSITWEKVNGVNGYEVQLATDKKFKKNKKTITVNNQKTTVKKLKSNKKYYVRIRTYKMSKGTKVYSSWSKVKSIKTK